MKKLVVIGIALGLVFGLAGCGAGTPEDPVQDVTHNYVETNDGRVLYCVAWGSAMSCDWENAK